MAHARLPEPFVKIGHSQMEAAIFEANLGRENTEIAKLRLIDQLPQIEIAAELGIDRKTIYSRMPEILKKVESTVRRLSSA